MRVPFLGIFRFGFLDGAYRSISLALSNPLFWDQAQAIPPGVDIQPDITSLWKSHLHAQIPRPCVSLTLPVGLHTGSGKPVTTPVPKYRSGVVAYVCAPSTCLEPPKNRRRCTLFAGRKAWQLPWQHPSGFLWTWFIFVWDHAACVRCQLDSWNRYIIRLICLPKLSVCPKGAAGRHNHFLAERPSFFYIWWEGI